MSDCASKVLYLGRLVSLCALRRAYVAIITTANRFPAQHLWIRAPVGSVTGQAHDHVGHRIHDIAWAAISAQVGPGDRVLGVIRGV